MKKKEITLSSIFKRQSDSFLKKAALAKNLSVKNIHDLRVDIKHLRALLRLVKLFPGNKIVSDNILKQLRSLFKSAGEIRTASVNLSLIQNISGLSAYAKHLRKMEKASGGKLKASLKKFNKELFRKNNEGLVQKLSPVKRETVIEKSLKYTENTRKKIKSVTRARLSDEALHEIRKDLKIIKSTIRILYKLSQQKLFKKQIKALTVLEESIGIWHDKAVLYQDFLLFKKNERHSPVLTAYALTIHKEAEGLKRSVGVLLKTYLA